MSRRRVVYIAGPMRGYPDDNVEAFRAATDQLRALGHLVTSPVEVGEALRGDVGRAPTSAEYLRADLREMLDCDAIALLPGWEHSTGARCEATVAVTLGFAFCDPATGARVSAPTEIVCRGGYERAVDLPSLAAVREAETECHAEEATS
jgi:nucleoside 2-deoxyribosyltransferase